MTKTHSTLLDEELATLQAVVARRLRDKQSRIKTPTKHGPKHDHAPVESSLPDGSFEYSGFRHKLRKWSIWFLHFLRRPRRG